MANFVKYGPKGCSKCTESVPDFLKNFEDIFIEGSDGGDWEIEIVEMSQEEYDALPEFDGF